MHEVKGWSQFWRSEPNARIVGWIKLSFYEPALKGTRYILEDKEGERFALPVHSDLSNKLAEIEAIQRREHKPAVITISRLPDLEGSRRAQYRVEYELDSLKEPAD